MAPLVLGGVFHHGHHPAGHEPAAPDHLARAGHLRHLDHAASGRDLDPPPGPARLDVERGHAGPRVHHHLDPVTPHAIHGTPRTCGEVGSPRTMPHRTVPLRHPLDLSLTLWRLLHGPADPTARLTRAEPWRAPRTRPSWPDCRTTRSTGSAWSGAGPRPSRPRPPVRDGWRRAPPGRRQRPLAS